MCGIHAVVSAKKPDELSPTLKRCLCNRGPDHIRTTETRLDGDDSSTFLEFTSTVLALRGDHLAQQPFTDSETGSVFCWNGEAWKIRHHDVSGNDGEVIALLLNAAVRDSQEDREGAILGVLSYINGPFAFVFFDKTSRKLYFGRDRLGRRSLLIKHDGSQLILSSIADTTDPEWEEVEADGIYVADLQQRQPKETDGKPFVPITRHDWLVGDDREDFVSFLRLQILCPNLYMWACYRTYVSRFPVLANSTVLYQLKPQHVTPSRHLWQP